MDDLKEKLRQAKEVAYKRNLQLKREKKEAKKTQRQETVAKEKALLVSSINPNIDIPSIHVSNELRDVIEAGPSSGDTLKLIGDVVVAYKNVPVLNTPIKPQRLSEQRKKRLDIDGDDNILTVDQSSKQTVKSRKKTDKNKDPRAYKRERELANARTRKYLAKMTEEQREIRRAKDREYYRKKKEEGKKISVNSKSKKEQKEQRKRWRVASARYRQRGKDQKLILTPPESENEMAEAPVNQAIRRGRKKVKRDRTKAYRALHEMKIKYKKLETKCEGYKKRLQRVKKENILSNIGSPSPNTKVNKLLGNLVVTPEVKRQLLFGEVREATLKKNRQGLGADLKAKQAFDKCVSGELISKYKVTKCVQSTPRKKQIQLKKKLNILEYERKPRAEFTINKIKNKVKEFYLKDENSRMCPGKRDYIRRNKIKIQKKLLMDSIKNLHLKFVENNPDIKICLTTFVKYKPFWVVKPNMRDRETCLCEKHSNFFFLLNRLTLENVTNIRDSDSLIKATCCSHFSPYNIHDLLIFYSKTILERINIISMTLLSFRRQKHHFKNEVVNSETAVNDR